MKELEEAINNIRKRNRKLKENIEKGFYYGEQYKIKQEINDIETVLKALDNSIPKEKIEEILEDYQERKRYYDDKNIANDEEYCRIEGVIRISRELLEGK